MDQESLTLTWPDADALLVELRILGGNADPDALGRPAHAAMARAAVPKLQATARPGRPVTLDFELVYGHAFRAAPKPRVSPQTTVGLEEFAPW